MHERGVPVVVHTHDIDRAVNTGLIERIRSSLVNGVVCMWYVYVKLHV